MEQMQKLMRQLEDQEQFPGPAIPSTWTSAVDSL